LANGGWATRSSIGDARSRAAHGGMGDDEATRGSVGDSRATRGDAEEDGATHGIGGASFVLLLLTWRRCSRGKGFG
jgi:hypothetical protein